MKKTTKEKKNFTLTTGLIDEFNTRCVPPGSNASAEIERLIRAEIRRCDAKENLIEWLFETSEARKKEMEIRKNPGSVNLLECFPDLDEMTDTYIVKLNEEEDGI